MVQMHAKLASVQVVALSMLPIPQGVGQDSSSIHACYAGEVSATAWRQHMFKK